MSRKRKSTERVLTDPERTALARGLREAGDLDVAERVEDAAKVLIRTRGNRVTHIGIARERSRS